MGSEKSTMIPDFPEDKHGVAICAIQKDGQAYVDEWVNYYFSLGVSNIYIYDNSDGYQLQQWGELRTRLHNNATRKVLVTHFPGAARQKQAYDQCIATIRQENESRAVPLQWAALYDLDEFLVLKKHDTIGELLQEHCDVDKGCGGLVVNWYYFGPNGNFATAYAPLPLTKRFQYRSSKADQHVKTIVHVKHFQNADIHCSSYRNNLTQFDTNGRAGCPFNQDGPVDVAVIHHIYTKSLTEWNSRCARGRATTNETSVQLCNKPIPLKGATVFDDSAWQFLKKRIPEYQWYDDTTVFAGRNTIP
jgi:hypothetical protein